MQIGKINALRIDRFTSVGAFLSDEEGNEVLLPKKYLTEDLTEEDNVNVFVYRDSEDRIVATTEIPDIELNGFAVLPVKEVNFFGAFADWGLEKDLMIPFKEQQNKLEEGRSYMTCLLLDESTDRLYGSTRIKKYLQECTEDLAPNTEVNVLVWERSDLGMKVIVDNKYSGLIFNNDLSRNLIPGEYTKGYVAKVREDGKLDIRLEPSGYGKISESAERLLDILKRRKRLSVNDKSDPDDIRDAVAMSKKTFKQAVGALYKQRLVEITDDGIFLKE